MDGVIVIVVMEDSSIITGLITGGDGHGVWVQEENSLPKRQMFSLMRSMTVL